MNHPTQYGQICTMTNLSNHIPCSHSLPQAAPQPQIPTQIILKKPVKLKNLINGEQTVDLLHNKLKRFTVNKSSLCDESRCLAAIYNQQHNEHKLRDLNQTLEQAQDFINQFYQSIKRLDSPAHKNRLTEIEEQLRNSGRLYLKETELIFGAKLAWRNAARCVGRIQWSKLQVFDARFTTNAQEMFEAICNHIKYATNRGKLRSAITIFPERVKSTKNDWRIWNNQLIGYAGYKDKERGTIIGDPTNVEITEVAQRLGWKGKGTRFDVLPLVLSAAGGAPEVFPLPEELVLRVKISHPKLPWFKDLGLEWYALPAVANMMLDVAGLQYTAAPFSGWYMVTEIGTRDLADPHRYNVLEEVGQKMGLNTTSNASLWKDKALVELNYAVLDSFQSAGVTIVDHHTACETFMTHLQNEQRLRGGCPADWVWLVPPTSGSLTQVFHQEMINYHLLPNYEYMEPMWKLYDWAAHDEAARLEKEKLLAKRRGSLMAGHLAASGLINDGLVDSIGVVEKQLSSSLSPTSKALLPLNGHNELTPKRLRFKEIARAVKFTSKLFGKALSRRIKATILYATETGKSERFANKLAQTFSCAFNVHLMSMVDYDMTCLEHEALLLIVTSTFGNGDPPENGELFAKHLAAVKLTGDTSPDIDSINSVSTNPFFQMMSEDHSAANARGQLSRGLGLDADEDEGTQMVIRPLSNVRFGVFALGSTAYPHYCAFGRFVDQILGELGAERISKCSLGDELCGQEKAFNEWSSQIFKRACEVFCITDQFGQGGLDERQETVWSPMDVKFVPVEIIDGDICVLVRNLSSISSKKIIPFKVKNRFELHEYKPEENVQTFCMELDCDRLQVGHFQPGDHVAICPTNNLAMVQKIITRMQNDCKNDFNFDQVYTILVKRDNMDLTPAPLANEAAAAAAASGSIVGGAASSSHNSHTGNGPNSSDTKWITHDRLPITSVREALSRYLDITSTPNQEFLLILSRHTTNPEERKRLELIGSNFTIYEEWKNQNSPNLGTLLDEFKTCKFEPALITQIPLLKPRFYSVSGTSIALTVGVVRFKTASGELRDGLCSNYLLNLPIDSNSEHSIVYGYIRSAPAFHMPTLKSIPMLLISAGTGIAPFRAFWQQRLADMKMASLTGKDVQFGRIKLYFGCRNSDYILYRDELEDMHRLGVISSIHIGFSRPKKCDVYSDQEGDHEKLDDHNTIPFKCANIKQANKKTYVQDKLVEDNADVYELIMNEGAHVYVCGDVSMADGVYKTLVNIFSNHLKAMIKTTSTNVTLSESADDNKRPQPQSQTSLGSSADEILMNLRNSNRYHEDIFGAKQVS